jgi:hypothetical protein
MSLWRVFESAFVRKVAFILAAALMGLVLGRHAHAQTCGNVATQWTGCSLVSDPGGPYATAEAAFAACIALNSGPGSGCTGGAFDRHGCGYTAGPCTYTSGTAALCAVYYHGVDNGDGNSAESGSGPRTGSLPNMDIVSAAGHPGTIPGVMCVGGCAYVNGNTVLFVGGPRASVSGQAVPTGATCPANAVAGSQGNCASGGGVTTCVDSQANKAVVNGDVVAKTDIPPTGQCTLFASGGSVCTYTPTQPLQTPPAPSNDGTTVDTPEAVVVDSSQPGGTTGGVKGAVFSAAQNAASANVVSGTGKLPGSGSGTGAASSAANGDCGASGVNCTGDGATPDLSRADTIQSNTQVYLDAIKGSPLIVAITSIAQAFPDAACPSLPFTMFTKSVDLMPPACYVWSTYVAGPLSLVFLAIWAVWGIRVILSA